MHLCLLATPFLFTTLCSSSTTALTLQLPKLYRFELRRVLAECLLEDTAFTRMLKAIAGMPRDGYDELIGLSFEC